MTRDWSLLVSDQDILDLVSASNTVTIYPLAGRFVAIHDAIEKNDIGAIDKIEKESRAAGFRKVVAGIKRGLAKGDAWSARYTARAVSSRGLPSHPRLLRGTGCIRGAVRTLEH
jgi:hypothetical protein